MVDFRWLSLILLSSSCLVWLNCSKVHLFVSTLLSITPHCPLCSYCALSCSVLKKWKQHLSKELDSACFVLWGLVVVLVLILFSLYICGALTQKKKRKTQQANCYFWGQVCWSNRELFCCVFPLLNVSLMFFLDIFMSNVHPLGKLNCCMWFMKKIHGSDILSMKYETAVRLWWFSFHLVV